ncbi:Odorant receptor coreceptor [Frankliniella fusca]|uniref:Odorant receptor coreceptor n=1 Tax=Frankliniella fusca TaxID=407009 RepID=A0AAE1HTB6_9NEOP|nr:Odorant receptor coreceptor [Frankliniella fusca]
MGQKNQYRGLVADLMPNIRAMQISGLYLMEYHAENSAVQRLMRRAYSIFQVTIMTLGYLTLVAYLLTQSYNVEDWAAHTVTTLFFLHSLCRTFWLMGNTKRFYRMLDCWNTTNSHPMFAENDARHHQQTLQRQRRLLIQVIILTVVSVMCWIGITFVAQPVRNVPDPENENATMTVEVPQLMVGAWYPWDARHGPAYMFSFGFQVYWLLVMLGQANMYDVLLANVVVHACGQLRHLKEILRPLMELSAAFSPASGIAPSNGKIFTTQSAFSAKHNLKMPDMMDLDYRNMFNNARGQANLIQGQLPPVSVNGDRDRPPSVEDINPLPITNTLTLAKNTDSMVVKEEIFVRSAIKYWVERHKQLVKFVSYISLAFGGELLLHMLNATVILTILAYQATKVSDFDVFACSTAGYVVYSMAQIYLFCIHGNELIEESSTVMEAAYSCQWYDGSEEVKTFVQIVCQQCQKNLVVSGARFFTVSLDLFASVLGAMVTYFMVLIQLN